MAYERLDIEVTDGGSSRRVQRNLEDLGRAGRSSAEDIAQEFARSAISSGQSGKVLSAVLQDLQKQFTMTARASYMTGTAMGTVMRAAVSASKPLATLNSTLSLYVSEAGTSYKTSLLAGTAMGTVATAALAAVRPVAMLAVTMNAQAAAAVRMSQANLLAGTAMRTIATTPLARPVPLALPKPAAPLLLPNYSNMAGISAAATAGATNFAAVLQRIQALAGSTRQGLSNLWSGIQTGASSAAQAVRGMFAGFSGGGAGGGGPGAAAAAGAAAAGVHGITDAAKRASSALITMNTLMYSLQLGMIAVLAVKWADEWQSIQNKLDLVTSSTSELGAANERLYQIAQRTRSGYADVVDLFQSLRLQAENLGLSMKATADLTETVSMASQIGSRGPQQAAAGILQLTQAMALGRLSGQNLNSVLQATPRIAIAIAQGMGTTTSALRQLAEDEKLTADVITTALQDQAPVIAEEFLRLKPTISGAFTVLNNGAIEFIGRMEQATGFASILSNSVIALSRNMDLLAAGVSVVAAALLVAFGGAVQRAIIAVGLAIAANPLGAFIALVGATILVMTLLKDRFAEYPALLAGIAAAAAGLAIVLAGPLVASLAAATSAAWAFAVAVLANPLTWIVAAVMAAVAAIVYFGNATYEVNGKLVSGWQVVLAHFQGSIALMQSIWNDISEVVVIAARFILAVLTFGMSEVALAVYNNWDYILQLTSAIWAAIGETVLTAARYLLAVATLGLSEVVLAVYNHWDAVYKTTVDIWEKIKDYVLGVIRVLAFIVSFGMSEVAIYAYDRFAPAAAAAGARAANAYSGAFNASINNSALANMHAPTARPSTALSDIPGIPAPYASDSNGDNDSERNRRTSRRATRAELIQEEMRRIHDETVTAANTTYTYLDRAAYEAVDKFNANLRSKRGADGGVFQVMSPEEERTMLQAILGLDKAKRLQEARDTIMRQAIGPRLQYIETEQAIAQLLESNQISAAEAQRAYQDAAIAFYATREDRLSGQMLGRLQIMKELRDQATPLANAMKSIWETQTGPLRTYQTALEAITALERDRMLTAEQAANATRDATIAYLDTQTDAASGISRALLKVQQDANNVAQQMETMFSNAFSNLENAWVEFSKTGKLSLKSFFSGLQEDVARSTFKQYIGGPLANMLQTRLGIDLPGLRGPVGESRDNPMWVRNADALPGAVGANGLPTGAPGDLLTQAFNAIFGGGGGNGGPNSDPLGIGAAVVDMNGCFGTFNNDLSGVMRNGAGMFSNEFIAGAYLFGNVLGSIVGGKAGGIINTVLNGAMMIFGGSMGMPKGFATGGSFTVGGAGGVDSQLVSFRASPGERVSIDRAGQASQDNGGAVGNVNISIDARGADAGVELRIQRALREVLPEAVRQSRIAAAKDRLAAGSRQSLNSR